MSSGAAGRHVVQFYENVQFLHEAVARFLADGLHSGEPVVVIARPANREALAGRLAASRFDVPRLEGAGRLTFLDVDEALAMFMIDAEPNPELFRSWVAGMLRNLTRANGAATFRGYGELVDALCRRGNHEAAIRLETLWNELLVTVPCRLWCGYDMAAFDRRAANGHFRDVCQLHDHVIPAEPLGCSPGAKPQARQVVFVVDDDASVLKSVARLLATAGLTVRTFASAEELLGAIDQVPTDGCLVLDMQLIGMSGIDLQRRLAAVHSTLPIVAMSGSADPRIGRAALRLGATAFLRKPFEPQALFDAVGRVLAWR